MFRRCWNGWGNSMHTPGRSVFFPRSPLASPLPLRERGRGVRGWLRQAFPAAPLPGRPLTPALSRKGRGSRASDQA